MKDFKVFYVKIEGSDCLTLKSKQNSSSNPYNGDNVPLTKTIDDGF